MRFAYIDSQGNEISIPSVDALELRIELGAIGPDTELYDAQADRWGPAHTHDIYHTLVRSAESEGFVAPPPPVPSEPEASPAKSPSAPEPPAPHEPFFDLAAEIMSDDDALDPPSRSASPASADPGVDLDLDFTLVDLPGSAEPGAVSDDDAGRLQDGGHDGEEGAADELPWLEPPGEAPIEDLAPTGQPGAWAPGPDDGTDEGDSDLADDLEVDVPFDAMDFSGVAPSEDLELEGPLASMERDAAPAWLEHEGAWSDTDDDVMDFSRVRHTEEAEPGSQTPRADQRKREQRVPRSRPSPPRRPRSSGAPRTFVLVLVLAAVGVAGWYGWQSMAAGDGDGGTAAASPEFPRVTIPEIPDELLPRFRAMGEDALDETLTRMEGLVDGFSIAAEPRDEWLAGAYLGNASRYEDVQRYWEGVGAYVDRLREVDAELFHASFQAELQARAVPADTAAILQERADSGFLATRAQRAAAYGLMDDLVEASLTLHAFLLENESEITYEPAAGGVSRDPVLEAVPSSPELGNRMWDMVDRITGALDALGTLDRVTTRRLVGVLSDRVRRAGFE